MFRKLRRQLTLVCTLGTAVVLVGLSAGALLFSLSRMRLQYEDTFRGDLNTVFYYLQAQTSIDQTWLARTEANGGLVLGIRVGGRDLRYTGQEADRARLISAAFTAAGKYGFNPHHVPDSFVPGTVAFTLQDSGRAYRAAVAALPHEGGGLLHVVMLKDKSPEQEAQLQITLVFAGITVFAAVLLGCFAYYFAGRAIRPVRESHRRQTEFVSAASHELRTPLSVVRAGLGVLPMMPERAVEIAAKLDVECAQMARLVDDLLLLARADNHRWSMETEQVSVKTLMLRTYERYEAPAGAAGISLELHLAPDAPQNVACDRQRIAQVLTILLDNALRFTPAGGGIGLGALPEKGALALYVEDSGPGIPDDEKQRVFERFYQSDPARGDTAHHGLGLSIAREIAALHSGHIRVEDAPSGGARFTLALPL